MIQFAVASGDLAPIIVALGGFVATCGAVLLNCLSVKKHLRQSAERSAADRADIKNRIQAVHDKVTK